MKAAQYKNKRVILFNGPPRCGKDTLVNKLLDYYPKAENIKFSEPLKLSIPTFFGLTDNEAQYVEDNKDLDIDLLFGKSYRQSQISLSEVWAKPLFGTDIFGRIAASKIQKSENEIFFVSDSGFYPEASTVIDTFGEKNCMLIRLYRDGCDFKNDSRSYWDHSYLSLQETHLSNNLTIQQLVDTTVEVIDDWIQ